MLLEYDQGWERPHNYSAVSDTVIQSTRTADCVSVSWPLLYSLWQTFQNCHSIQRVPFSNKVLHQSEYCVALEGIKVNKTLTHCTYSASLLLRSMQEATQQKIFAPQTLQFPVAARAQDIHLCKSFSGKDRANGQPCNAFLSGVWLHVSLSKE